MSHHVLIAGGGIGGLTAALCCAARDMQVDVFEQAAAFGEVGAGLQLSPNCSRVLHALGLQDALAAHAFLPQSIEMRAWRDGRVLQATPLGAEATRRYGFPYYHIHRADLIGVLLAACRRRGNISLHADSPVERVVAHQQGVTLRVKGRDWQGDVLVGADGIRSVVREHLFGAEAPVFTGNVAWRGLVPASRLPAGLVRPVATAWWGPRKHFVHYFVRRGELVNCVCVVEKQGWEVESWSARGEHAELKADFRGWHRTVRELIANMDPDACFKWALYDRPPMPRWTEGHATLLGDACHPTLPFMAQGAAMAIEDAAVLAACLARATAIPAALERYEALRRERTAGVQTGSRRNATVFHLSGPAAWVRNRALKLASGSAMERLYAYDPLAAVAG
ncbi:MAG: FAD-dependent monooxygenase [Pseudomonadales bacterium]